MNTPMKAGVNKTVTSGKPKVIAIQITAAKNTYTCSGIKCAHRLEKGTAIVGISLDGVFTYWQCTSTANIKYWLWDKKTTCVA